MDSENHDCIGWRLISWRSCTWVTSLKFSTSAKRLLWHLNPQKIPKLSHHHPHPQSTALVENDLLPHLHHRQDLFIHILILRLPLHIPTQPPTRAPIPPMHSDLPRANIHPLRLPTRMILHLDIRPLLRRRRQLYLFSIAHAYTYPRQQHPKRAVPPNRLMIPLPLDPLAQTLDAEERISPAPARRRRLRNRGPWRCCCRRRWERSAAAEVASGGCARRCRGRRRGSRIRLGGVVRRGGG